MMRERIIDVTNKKYIDSLLEKGLKRVGRLSYRDVVALIAVEGHEYCQTIVLSRNQEWYYSDKTTRKIINEMGKRYGVTYEQFVDKTKNKDNKLSYKVPYIYKNIIAIPDSGTARGNVNWFFLQHIIGYDSLKPLYYIQLIYEDFSIQTKIAREGFYKQLDLIYRQYYQQIKEIKDWGFNSEVEESFIYQNAISFHEKKTNVGEWSNFY